MKKHLLLITLLSLNSFASGECSSDTVYDSTCGALDIIPSYQCALKTEGISSTCLKKSSDILSCSMSVLSYCQTPENDNANLFEVCLALSSDEHCQKIGQKYK